MEKNFKYRKIDSQYKSIVNWNNIKEVFFEDFQILAIKDTDYTDLKFKLTELNQKEPFQVNKRGGYPQDVWIYECLEPISDKLKHLKELQGTKKGTKKSTRKGRKK